MNIICTSCGARLQMHDARVPAHAFTVRCPKCLKTITVQPPPAEPSLPAEPAHAPLPPEELAAPAERARFSVPVAAPLYRSPEAQSSASSETGESAAAPPPLSDLNELARTLAALLQQASPHGPRGTAHRGRKVLTCVAAAYQDAVALPLAENGYEVYAAADAMQAFERMRQDQVDILVLDPEFDAKGQGYLFVQREIREMRPANRRRLFVVYLSPSVRSGDAHTAFLHSANLVIHPDEAAELPQILETVRRDHDELYRVFREALAVVA